MFETLLFDIQSIARHEQAAYTEERLRYLSHCAQCGNTRRSLQNKRSGVYWAAHVLGPNANLGVTADQFQAAAQQWAVDHGFPRNSTMMQLIRIARPGHHTGR
jgi:hypothetical protein